MVTTALDPARARQLVAEAREDDARMTRAPWSPDGFFQDANDGDVIDETDHKFIAHVGRHPVVGNGEGIARTRNNLAALADQLEAALAEIERLRAYGAVVEARVSARCWSEPDPERGKMCRCGAAAAIACPITDVDRAIVKLGDRDPA